MNFLELNVDNGLDTLADVIAPICEIAMDKRTSSLFEKEDPKEGETRLMLFSRRMKGCLPVLIKDHKQSLIEILAIMNGISVEDYMRDKKVTDVIVDIFEFINNPALESLF